AGVSHKGEGRPGEAVERPFIDFSIDNTAFWKMALDRLAELDAVIQRQCAEIMNTGGRCCLLSETLAVDRHQDGKRHQQHSNHGWLEAKQGHCPPYKGIPGGQP